MRIAVTEATGFIGCNLAKFLNDKELAGSMVAKGLQRVAEFSWKKCAARTLEAIREAARAH
jgi:glycosyltransferase involved in cell wall biosynthesis